ncbi:MAG: hypothetical protein LC799_06210, partial [Actinobacteria bacterium]|nr:hypothetical protein [Actinomycetota bacterium]
VGERTVEVIDQHDYTLDLLEFLRCHRLGELRSKPLQGRVRRDVLVCVALVEEVDECTDSWQRRGHR